jgi:predicted nucleotidyltransferase
MDEKDYEICGVKPVDYKWINDFIKNLNKKINLKKIILFGSRARNEHITYSDYDVVIISDDFKDMKPFERMSFILKFWDGKRALEPLCYTEKEFEKNKSIIGEEIKKYGKILYEKNKKEMRK